MAFKTKSSWSKTTRVVLKYFIWRWNWGPVAYHYGHLLKFDRIPLPCTLTTNDLEGHGLGLSSTPLWRHWLIIICGVSLRWLRCWVGVWSRSEKNTLGNKDLYRYSISRLLKGWRVEGLKGWRVEPSIVRRSLVVSTVRSFLRLNGEGWRLDHL